MTRFWQAMTAPEVEPSALLRHEAGPSAGRSYYASRGGWEIVGLGEAVVLRASGADRFETLAFDAERLFASLEQVGSREADVTPMLIGGFSFLDGWDGPGGSAWAGFSSARLVLPRVAVVRRGESSWLVGVAPEGLSRAAASEHLRQILGQCGELMLRLARTAETDVLAPAPVREAADPKRFEGRVVAALETIAAGVFSKVIVARAETWVAESSPPTADLLAGLGARFPGCFRFAVQPPGGATFVGASPERLAAVAGGRLETDALAGTAARSTEVDEDRALGAELLASDKERREHQSCVSYLRRTLVEVLDELPPPTEPGLLQLANVQHLHTELTGRLTNGQGVLDIASLLHPTPAVCGVPGGDALRWLGEHEDLDRGWYAGGVGVVGPGGDGEFCMAIRSALLDGGTTRLFAGAGIVAGSRPERERAEVDAKLNGIREVLFDVGA